MKRITLLLSILFISLGAFAQTTWSADPYHSTINFKIKHMGLTFIPGKFDKFSGTMTSSKADFSDAKIAFTVESNSINTGVEPRDKHLKSADFFDVEKFPALKFVSTEFKKSNADKYILKGNLTIKDVTKPVTFEVKYGGKTKDQEGNPKIGFTAKNTINRFDYNVSYDPTGTAVAKDVDIIIYLEMTPKK